MSSLPERIEQHRPNPLGEEAQRANRGSFANAAAVADRLALLAADKADLPPALKKARAEFEQAEALCQQSEAKIAASFAAWRLYQDALAAIQILREDVATLETKVALCQKDTESLQPDCDTWALNIRQQPFALMINRVQISLAARELLKLLPASLKTLRGKLHKAEADVAAMEKANGFTPDAAARPASQGPQPEAELKYEDPAGFRGAQ